ncbi:Wzz/FepE/Etk N-terminal domain-containing protein [uncultured Draconibacterium sp.]|uniref:Wzz/FepE/Etk N-terminal domain-containing protein n=1 Tax=uncultured Draconibacterium sp. TaxID=1573823 RepID=UPI0029C69B39|nr:Wzz/FepE/Etk N-terminal domain-containing protein [uncultured Draconibacterium sp.]
MTEEIKSNQLAEDEIDLIALAKTLWDNRRFIIITVAIFMVLGVAVALLTPKEYTASTTLVPQVSKGSTRMGGLSSLAAMAGFNLNDMTGSSGELSPMVYPQIVKSVPFQLELMNTPFRFPGQEDALSIYTYYTEVKEPGFLEGLKKYTIGLPGVIIKAIRGEQVTNAPMTNDSMTNDSMTSDYITLTEKQDKVRKMLSDKVNLEVNDKDGYLTLSATTLDPKLAAQLTTKAQTLLQNTITEFKIEKANTQLDFIRERYNEKKKAFEEAQATLAQFRDRNKNVTSALARTTEEQLQNEYQLAFEVYSQLAQQLEQAQIQVKEDTPVFSVLKPVTVPLEDNASGFTTLVIFIFLGAVIGVGWLLGKEILETLKERWNTPGA